MAEKKAPSAPGPGDEGDESLEREIDGLESFLQEAEDLTRDVAVTAKEQAGAVAVVSGKKEDPQRRWIAEGLQQPVEVLTEVNPGPEAGKDAEATFYTLTDSGVGVAVRQDGLRVYLTKVAPEVEEGSQVEAVLRSLHLAKVDAAAIKSALKRN
ncbi:MAG: hypothetical protein WDA75_09885, partial [Candidatus Latescibacterota bacterium]